MILRTGRCLRARSSSSPSRRVSPLRSGKTPPGRRSASVRCLTRAQIKRTAVETTGQSKNLLWRKLRQNLLTASNFGKAYRALLSGNNEILANFLKNCIAQQQQPASEFDSLADRVPAIKWGLDHEKRAIRKYEKVRNVKVQPTGLWLSADGCLGASPDGLVKGKKGIVEVKCPYSCRFLDSWAEAIETGLVPRYLDLLGENGDEIALKKNHDYYFQVQGQLYTTSAKWCDFVVWAPGFIKITRVYPDKEWARGVPSLLSSFAKRCLLKRTGSSHRLGMLARDSNFV